jgi:hypothetical protein
MKAIPLIVKAIGGMSKFDAICLSAHFPDSFNYLPQLRNQCGISSNNIYNILVPYCELSIKSSNIWKVFRPLQNQFLLTKLLTLDANELKSILKDPSIVAILDQFTTDNKIRELVRSLPINPKFLLNRICKGNWSRYNGISTNLISNEDLNSIPNILSGIHTEAITSEYIVRHPKEEYGQAIFGRYNPRFLFQTAISLGNVPDIRYLFPQVNNIDCHELTSIMMTYTNNYISSILDNLDELLICQKLIGRVLNNTKGLQTLSLRITMKQILIMLRAFKRPKLTKRMVELIVKSQKRLDSNFLDIIYMLNSKWIKQLRDVLPSFQVSPAITNAINSINTTKTKEVIPPDAILDSHNNFVENANYGGE